MKVPFKMHKVVFLVIFELVTIFDADPVFDIVHAEVAYARTFWRSVATRSVSAYAYRKHIGRELGLGQGTLSPPRLQAAPLACVPQNARSVCERISRTRPKSARQSVDKS